MRYNLAVKQQAEDSITYLAKLIGQEAIIDLKKVNPKRSLPQNAYLHLILSAFGLHFGYTIEESKQIYKTINDDTYNYTKENRGKKTTFTRSSADLDKDEMAKTIDKFIRTSADAGYDLPPATNQEWLMAIQNEIERSSYYL